MLTVNSNKTDVLLDCLKSRRDPTSVEGLLGKDVRWSVLFEQFPGLDLAPARYFLLESPRMESSALAGEIHDPGSTGRSPTAGQGVEGDGGVR